MNTLPHVVVIGAGFGGMRAAKQLAHAPVQVTVIDRRNYHLFQPMLYQVATAGISPSEIAFPVRTIFRRQHNVDFMMAEVKNIDFDSRTVITGLGNVSYDYLVIAAGASVNFFGNSSLENNAHTLKTLDDAISLRNHFLTMFELAEEESDPEKRRALLTFVIVGGGPTGVESAGALSELIRLVLRKDHPNLNLSEVRVILLEAANAVLSTFSTALQQATVDELTQKHVEVWLGAKVASYENNLAQLEDGRTIPANTLLWSAGVRAVELLDGLGLTQARLGRVVVQQTLNLASRPEVFVIGDAAYLEEDGRPLPMMAPVAVQQANVAAANIITSLAGRPLEDFHFHDPGSLATIGRNAAVARIGKWQFKGFTAWFVWLVVHLIGLIGFRNKLVVLINWMWDYFFYDRAVRLITEK